MMRFGHTTDSYPKVNSYVADVAVFLDQFAMKRLAKEPHQLARIYAEGELRAFVEDLESKVRQRDLRQPSAAPLA
jgi:hypothetical protein